MKQHAGSATHLRLPKLQQPNHAARCGSQRQRDMCSLTAQSAAAAPPRDAHGLVPRVRKPPRPPHRNSVLCVLRCVRGGDLCLADSSCLSDRHLFVREPRSKFLPLPTQTHKNGGAEVPDGHASRLRAMLDERAAAVLDTPFCPELWNVAHVARATAATSCALSALWAQLLGQCRAPGRAIEAAAPRRDATRAASGQLPALGWQAGVVANEMGVGAA
eukprot:365082-Chlamydomonas_euryale.AAC.4